MIRLSRLADYGLVLACEMTLSEGKLYSARGLSHKTMISEATVSKLLKLMTKAKVTTSIRGAKGGYKLIKPAEEVSVLDVISAIDGPIALTQCSSSDSQNCQLESLCIARSGWQKINQKFNQVLRDVSLEDFINTESEFADNSHLSNPTQAPDQQRSNLQ